MPFGVKVGSSKGKEEIGVIEIGQTTDRVSFSVQLMVSKLDLGSKRYIRHMDKFTSRSTNLFLYR